MEIAHTNERRAGLDANVTHHAFHPCQPTKPSPDRTTNPTFGTKEDLTTRPRCSNRQRTMATLTNLMMNEQRDDAESQQTSSVKGDYFFLFDNHVENRFAKPRREPRSKRIFRRLSRRATGGNWRRSTRMLGDSSSPDTTALMSEDEHSLIHSHVSVNEEDEELVSTTTSEYDPTFIWPETLSLGEEHEQTTTGTPVESPKRDIRKRRMLMKRWKSRMKKSLRDALAKTQSSFSGEDTEEYAVKVKEAEEEDGDDEKSTNTNMSMMSLLERARRSIGVSVRSLGAQRAKAVLHEEEIGLYVNPDDEVETVTRSTFEQLCVPSFQEQRDSPPQSFPESVSLDNGYAIAHLMHHGRTSLAVNYDSDCAQLELQSDDEYDPEDDISFTEEEPALPELGTSGSEETEYNLFNQSSVEEDNTPCGKYPSLLAPTSTVSEDPSLLDGAAALGMAWPLPHCRNQQDEVVLSGSSDDPLFMQQSTSTDMYSVSSRRLGATPHPASVKKHHEKALGASSSSEEQEEHRLGITCPSYAAKSSLEDAADVWKRIYAPPEEAPPSPTIVQKSRATWGCGLDASPVSVNSDITESEAVAPTRHNPFYNIRRYTASCGVVEEEDHPFDEVDSDVRAPRPIRPPAPVRQTSFGCGVPRLIGSINLSHKDNKEEVLGHSVVNNEEKKVRPRCECVKCSVTNMYANLLSKNK